MDALIMKYLLDEVSVQEERELFEWIEKHPNNKVKFEQTKKMLFFPGRANINFDPDIDKGWENVLSKIELDNNNAGKLLFRIASLNKLHVLNIAVAILLLVGMIFGFNAILSSVQSVGDIADFIPSENAGLQMTEKAAGGELTVFYLPDSSLVLLNKNSKLYYPTKFSGQERVVYLEGESFFEVTWNPNKPFIVHAANTKTTVLGTSFNIKAYRHQNEVELTVASGKVVFLIEKTAKDRILVLERDDKAVYDKTDISVIKKKNDNPNYLAWINEDEQKEVSENNFEFVVEQQTDEGLVKFREEVEFPEKYLNLISNWYNTYEWKNRLIKKTMIEGVIYSSALFASYNNLNLKVTFYNSDDQEIGAELFEIKQPIDPGKIIKFKRKIDNRYADVSKALVEIEEAGVNKMSEKPAF